MGLWVLWVWGSMGLGLSRGCYGADAAPLLPHSSRVLAVQLQGWLWVWGLYGSVGSMGVAMGLTLPHCRPLVPPRSRRRGCAAARPSGGLWVLWVLWVWGSLGIAMGCYGADPAPLHPPGAGIVGVPL